MCARALPASVALSDHACALVSLGRLLRALLEAEAALWPVTIMGNMEGHHHDLEQAHSRQGALQPTLNSIF